MPISRTHILRWFFHVIFYNWRFRLRDLPPALVKATEDPFDYLVTLETGESVYVEQIDLINRRWVKLTLSHGTLFRNHPCPRGLEVRTSAIITITDAPNGS